jgi:hypothetical protein
MFVSWQGAYIRNWYTEAPARYCSNLEGTCIIG